MNPSLNYLENMDARRRERLDHFALALGVETPTHRLIRLREKDRALAAKTKARRRKRSRIAARSRSRNR